MYGAATIDDDGSLLYSSFDVAPPNSGAPGQNVGLGHGDAVHVGDFKRGTLLTATGTLANNGTKGNPGLVADILGDWREELVVRTTDSTAARLHISTEVTNRKLYTLMRDPQYRVEVARQQTGYNQPAYPGFYLATDLDWAKVPVPRIR